jgi:hypothetical protein
MQSSRVSRDRAGWISQPVCLDSAAGSPVRKCGRKRMSETLTGEILWGLAPLHRLKLVCKVSFDEP